MIVQTIILTHNSVFRPFAAPAAGLLVGGAATALLRSQEGRDRGKLVLFSITSISSTISIIHDIISFSLSLSLSLSISLSI